jgi:hypothetical protein
MYIRFSYKVLVASMKENKSKTYMQNIQKIGYLVEISKTTFPNLICNIKVVSGSLNLPEGQFGDLILSAL